MNKEELVQEISKKANVTQKEAAEVLSSLRLVWYTCGFEPSPLIIFFSFLFFY